MAGTVWSFRLYRALSGNEKTLSTFFFISFKVADTTSQKKDADGVVFLLEAQTGASWLV